MKLTKSLITRFAPLFILLFAPLLFFIVWLVSFYVDFFIWPSERFSKSSRDFLQNCKSLKNQDYSATLLDKLQGHCVDTCGESCSQFVGCTEKHFSLGLAEKKLTVTKNPGAPEGWYCRIVIKKDGKMSVYPEFIID